MLQPTYMCTLTLSPLAKDSATPNLYTYLGLALGVHWDKPGNNGPWVIKYPSHDFLAVTGTCVTLCMLLIVCCHARSSWAVADLK